MGRPVLCRNLYSLVQVLRCKVSAIRPAYGVQFRVQDELFEIRKFAQRLKYLSAEFTTEIYIAFGSVGKTKMNRKLLNMMCFNDSWRHNAYSNGAIF